MTFYKEDINLLPYQYQRSRRHQLYLAGVGRLLNRIYLLLGLVVVELIAIYYVFSLINGYMQEAVNNSVQTRLDTVERVRAINLVLDEYEKRLDGYELWTNKIEEVLSLAPSGLVVSGLQVDKEGGPLMIKGVSGDRSKVVQFQHRLEKIEWISRVEAPLQNFSIGTDSGFSFKLFMKK